MKRNNNSIKTSFMYVDTFSALANNRGTPNRSTATPSWPEVLGLQLRNKELKKKMAVLSGNNDFGKPILDGFTTDEFEENVKKIFDEGEIKKIFGGNKDFRLAWNTGSGVCDNSIKKAMVAEWAKEIAANETLLAMKKLEVLTPQPYSGRSVGLNQPDLWEENVRYATTALFTPEELSAMRKDTNLSNEMVGGILRSGRIDSLNMRVIDKLRVEYGKQITTYYANQMKQEPKLSLGKRLVAAIKGLQAHSPAEKVQPTNAQKKEVSTFSRDPLPVHVKKPQRKIQPVQVIETREKENINP